MESVPFFAREAELASRSDTGLRKQTGEGEAFTGGGMLFPPKKGVCPVFCPRSGTGIAERYWPAQADWRRRSLYWRRGALPAKKRSLSRFLPAERNWHREAILACASRLAKAKPLLAAGCSSRQKVYISPSFLTLTQTSKINIIGTRRLKVVIIVCTCSRDTIK